MKLPILYDDRYQTIELDESSTEQLWISLDLDVDGLPDEERDALIRKEWDKRFNRPEYNNRHRHYRHWGESAACFEDSGPDNCCPDEPHMSEVADDRIYRRDEIDRDERYSYEAICGWIRGTLADKPHWAEAFIAVRIDGMTVNDYTAKIGASDASVVSHWLTRATKKLKELYPKRQI